ncbi:MAG: acyl-CoA dehydratase activase [Thermodesulfobacteriota bacterium]
MKAGGYYLGVDLGSVSLDGMVVDGCGRLLWHSYRKVQGRSRDAVARLCRQLLEEWLQPNKVSSFAGALATGSGKEIVQEMLGVPAVNEIVAHGTAAAGFAGGRASVIEIGGQDSKFILVDEKGPYDYAMNELCAAGTGAFLDVQAERLGLTIEDLSAMAAGAETVPAMAGRCSVFAKSDIIHLQQRGVPVDQIVAGLCHALARNYVANLIRGREVVRPVVFQGGVALNQGVIRAFKDILALDEADIIRPAMPHMAGALGAALLSAGLSSGLDAAVVERVAAAAPAGNGRDEGFSTRGWQLDEAATRLLKGLESARVVRPPAADEQVFIGLDIGSISTKAVALTAAGELLAEVYIFTAGKPLEAASRALACLGESISETAIAAVGVTGSGRKLVGHAVGADLVLDEITAQARGAWLGSAGADTVIEIGGQDAKFIRLGRDGTVLDFEMNRACSAGTGSFIQEQAVRLGVDLKEDYARLALSSRQPLPFTSRCTVFMESDLVHHIQQGVPLPDLLMGVSQAVVENYIDRVVQGRSFGRHVVLQGGVARNRAVVQAFRNRLRETEVVVHDHPGISGALGMAALTHEMFLAKKAAEPGFTTSFKGFRFSTSHRETTFACSGCENRCQVSAFHFQEGRFHFGDLCGRYSEAISGLTPGRDLTPDLTGVISDDSEPGNFIATVGIPRALLFREFYPFWRKYFQQLSIRVKVSAPSSSDCLALALTRLPAETCLPVKLLFGHVAALEKEGVDAVFIPSTSRLLDGVSCPYIQHGASMVQANFDAINVAPLPLLPDLPAREREKLSLRAAELFGVDSAAAELAYEAAAGELASFQQSIEYDPRAAGPREKPLAVLLGKPYNIGDRFANMSLAAKLAKAGFDVITYEQLSTALELPLPGRYNSITWAFSRRMLKIGIWITSADDIYPVVVGNFGCGPDSFTFPLLQEIFAERPSLFLEFDEHRADAGLATRVEAFAHRVAAWRDKGERGLLPGKGEKAGVRKKRGSRKPLPAKASEYIIPYFSDHAHAFAGAIRAEGIRARVLPLPDHSSYEAAVEFSGGKQCHPFQLIAGDLIKLARSGDLPEGAAFLLPTLESNCMITQYAPTMQLYMDRLNRNDVRVINTNSLELLDRFGAMFVFKLGKAILGIEYLSRMRFEMRPYALEKGAVDRAYFAALDIILQSQLEGKVNRGIMRAAQLLAAVPTRPRGGRPVIAVTGDVYTRVNPVANGGLFDLLEELGCEVWPSPTLVDVIMTGQEVRARQFWDAGKTLNMMSSWGRVLVNNLGAGYVSRNFQGRLVNFSEPHAEEVLRYTEGILPGEPELLVSLNVAKHVDFANKGVDGILNVYCLNCLVGTTTTSVFKRLTERVAGVPIMPLVFDAMGRTHVRNRVEAFVHRVERNREEKLERMAATAGGDSGDGGGHVARLKELLDQKLADVKMPNMRLSGLKLPEMRIPNVRLPEGLWGWKKKKENGTEVHKE